MADVNKSIEISMKADLKDLTAKLKQIPGLTAKEAKGMVSALQKELKQAQRAAQKTAKTNKKAMQQIEKSTKRATQATRNMRKQSREMGAAFGSMENVVSAVNPELADMATVLATVGQAGRVLSRTLATGNPIIIALIAAVSAVVAGYTLFTAKAREAERQQKLFKEATQQATEALSKQADIVRGISNDYTNAERDLMVFTGQMSELDADIAKAREANTKALEKDLQAQKEFIDQQRNLLKIAEKAKENASQLTEEEKKQLEHAMSLTGEKRLQTGLSVQYGTGLIDQNKATADMFFLEQHISKNLKNQTLIRDRIREARGKELENVIQLLQFQKELSDEAEAEAERERKRQEARQRASKRRAEIEAASKNLASKRSTIQDQIYNSSLKQMSVDDQIKTKYEKQLESLEEQRQAIYDQYDTTEAIAKTEKERQEIDRLNLESAKAIADLDTREHQLTIERDQELAELAQKRNEERKKAAKEQADLEEKLHKQAIAQNEATIQATIGGLQQFATNGLQLLENTENKNRDLINFLFRVNQAAALADIAMSTAKAIARAPADYGPGAPLAIAAITAGAAAQAGVVMSQKPPLHMGGMVEALAPDEQQRTVLTGEAVLDRATTRRLGQDGIQRLQEGKSPTPEVIVMNPFKHLDRYNRSAMRSPNTAFSKFGTKRKQRY